jgi:hypothetical protein
MFGAINDLLKKEKNMRPSFLAYLREIENFDGPFEEKICFYQKNDTLSYVTDFTFEHCSCPIDQHKYISKFLSKMCLNSIEFISSNIKLDLIKDELYRIPSLKVWGWKITQENFVSFCNAIKHFKNLKTLDMNIMFSTEIPTSLFHVLTQSLCRSNLCKISLRGSDHFESKSTFDLSLLGTVIESCPSLKKFEIFLSCIQNKAAFLSFCDSLSRSKLTEVLFECSWADEEASLFCDAICKSNVRACSIVLQFSRGIITSFKNFVNHVRNLTLQFSYGSVDILFEYGWLIAKSCSLRRIGFSSPNIDVPFNWCMNPEIVQFKSILSNNGSIVKTYFYGDCISKESWLSFVKRNVLNLERTKTSCLVFVAMIRYKTTNYLLKLLAKDLTTLMTQSLLQTYADVTAWTQ